MKKALALGEIMLRHSKPEFERNNKSDSFDLCFGNGDALNACHAEHLSEDEGHWFKNKIEVRL